jgi:Transposase DNA-binding/Transposase DDE domain
MEKISHTPKYEGVFPDKRLDRRAQQLASLLISSRSNSIKGSTSNEAEQKGFYRFLDNERVTEVGLIGEITKRCRSNVKGRHVLCIQDTSSVGLNNHRNRLQENSGVGLVGNKTGLGFLLHASLVLDAEKSTMLGFSDIQLWHRTEDKANNTTQLYKKQPIEEKESFKWIKAARNSKDVLQSANRVTIIEDREGDIYEQFCLVPDEKTHLLIRSKDNRKLADGSFINESISKEKVAGRYLLNITSDIRRSRKGRVAEIEVRFKKIIITKPQGAKTKNLPLTKELYLVEAKEVNGPKNDSVKWRILTTHQVGTFKQANEIINMYKQRWYIEQLFRLLKKQGFQIEESELGTGWAIRKLTVLLLNNILRVMQLLLAYDNVESQSSAEVFNKDEIECLKELGKKLEQKQTQVKNLNPTKKLSWATWIIARLGGWKGAVKQRPPGPITMKKGLEKFDLIFHGWKLAKQLIT